MLHWFLIYPTNLGKGVGKLKEDLQQSKSQQILLKNDKEEKT